MLIEYVAPATEIPPSPSPELQNLSLLFSRKRGSLCVRVYPTNRRREETTGTGSNWDCLEGNVSDGYVLPLCQLRGVFWQIMRVARRCIVAFPAFPLLRPLSNILLVFVGGARAIIPFLCWQNLALLLARWSLFLSAAAAAALLFFVSARYARTSRPAGCIRGTAKRSSFSRLFPIVGVACAIQFNPIQSVPRSFN